MTCLERNQLLVVEFLPLRELPPPEIYAPLSLITGELFCFILLIQLHLLILLLLLLFWGRCAAPVYLAPETDAPFPLVTGGLLHAVLFSLFYGSFHNESRQLELSGRFCPGATLNWKCDC